MISILILSNQEFSLHTPHCHDIFKEEKKIYKISTNIWKLSVIYITCHFHHLVVPLLAGKYLIDFSILVVHIHHLLCIWWHVSIRSARLNLWSVRNNLILPIVNIIIHSAPFFSPNAIYMQIVPDCMVIQWIASEFQTLWSNLDKRTQVKMKVAYSYISWSV